MNRLIPPLEVEIDDYGPLYAARKKVYPQSVHGRFRRIKWTILCITLGVYYLLPFRARTALIAASSYIFYGWANPVWAALMFFGSSVDYVCGIGLLKLSRLPDEPPPPKLPPPPENPPPPPKPPPPLLLLPLAMASIALHRITEPRPLGW